MTNAKISIHLIQIKSRIVKRTKFACYIPGKKHRTKEVIRDTFLLTKFIGIIFALVHELSRIVLKFVFQVLYEIAFYHQVFSWEL